MTTVPPTAPSDHDTKGRFAVGNRGGPGNPLGRRVAEMRQILIDSLTDDAIRKLADVHMIARAQDGNVGAAKLLLSYALGKPPAAADYEGPPPEAWREGPFPAGINPAARQNDAPTAPTAPAMPPGQRKSPASRKAMKRMLRDLRRGNAPSPNGSIGNGSTGSADGTNASPNGPAETVRVS